MRKHRRKGHREFKQVLSEGAEGARGSFREVLDGSILTREVVVRQLPYILFLVVLAVIYIGNRYHAVQVVRESADLQKEVEELRSESMTTASELMFISRQSQVLRLLHENGLELEEPVDPPMKIVVNEKDIE